MKELLTIQAQYDEIDQKYAVEEFTAHSKGYFRKEVDFANKREVLTHAYFLFTFTRLEAHISNECKKLADRKRTNILHWKSRAIWDNIQIDNIHFKTKVGLLTQKGDADYSIIMMYYKKRNEIAHGGTIPGITNQIDMIDVFRQIIRLIKELKA